MAITVWRISRNILISMLQMRTAKFLYLKLRCCIFFFFFFLNDPPPPEFSPFPLPAALRFPPPSCVRSVRPPLWRCPEMRVALAPELVRCDTDARRPPCCAKRTRPCDRRGSHHPSFPDRSEEHTSELQSPCNLVCRLLLEKKK